MVATYEIMLESKLGGNSAHRRRGSSISSVASVIKESSSMSSESKIWNTLTHKEVVEVNGGPTGTTDQRFGNFGDLLPDTPIPRHRYSRSKESGLRQEPKSSRRAGTGVAHREINQDPLQYPGAAAQSRYFGTGFRWIEGANSAGISPPRLNINGANTYQFVMGNPVGYDDSFGLAARGRFPDQGAPNSVSERVGPDGKVTSRAFYNSKGQMYNRQDYTGEPHGTTPTPHEEVTTFNENGQPNGKVCNPLDPNTVDQTPGSGVKASPKGGLATDVEDIAGDISKTFETDILFPLRVTIFELQIGNSPPAGGPSGGVYH